MCLYPVPYCTYIRIRITPRCTLHGLHRTHSPPPRHFLLTRACCQPGQGLHRLGRVMTSEALDIALVDARTHPFAMQPACSQSLRLVGILPRGGTHRGGTLVHIASDPKRQGFAAASDPKCAFGNRHVRATVINATLLSCIAPAINLSDPLLSLAHGSRDSSLR